MAQKLIDAAGDQQIVFSTTGTTPPSGFSRAKERLDAAIALQQTAASRLPIGRCTICGDPQSRTWPRPESAAT